MSVTSPNPPRRVVIIGAGIAGLSAARAAADQARATGQALEILVLERAPVVGGKAQTIARDGWRLEGGPTWYLDNEPTMDTLVQAAGLTKLPADPAAARRFLVRNGQLKEIQAHPLKFATSGILSPLGLARLATEPWRPKRTESRDESVWEFARRRLGRQAADRLIGPMVLGVFAGDAKHTSLAAAFPRMAELEAEYCSLIKALIALQKKRTTQPVGGPAGPSGLLTSFANGLHSLPAQLAARGQAAGDFVVRCGALVQQLNHDGTSWRLRVETGDAIEAIHADAVILAGESFAAGALLRTFAPQAARELNAIQTPPIAVVGLGYGPAALAAAPKGFGALIQRGQGLRILGVLWDTHLFPQRSPDGSLLMRCLLGGATDPVAGALSDDELVSIARADLARLFRLTGPAAEPSFQEVVRWPRAIPQYELGHLARVARIREHLGKAPSGLFLAGNYLDGVAFTKAAKSGHQAGLAAAQATE